jgi:hypothetical protein
MVNTAANVAEHPMLSVDDSLFAQQNCVALTSKDERCSYGADGVLRLCHTHRDVEDLTVIDEFSDTVAELRADDTVPTRL